MSAALRSRYPAVTRACLEVALDNGGINRGRSIAKQGKELERFLAGRPAEELDLVEPWLASLTEDELRTVAAGGQDEPETIKLMERAPPFTDALLNAYFDEVC